MATMIVDELGRIPMSPFLKATLARSAEYATAQQHREVTLEHLLLALAEDPEASVVLKLSNVDITRLMSDVSGHLGRLEDRVAEPGAPVAAVISDDLERILKAAAAAAQQGRRREINGAIVLAAIVGDGKTPSAHMLRSQGLTFEEAIRALQRLATQPPPPQETPQAPAPASPPSVAAEAEASAPVSASLPQSDPMAAARERVLVRTGHVTGPPAAEGPPPAAMSPPEAAAAPAPMPQAQPQPYQPAPVPQATYQPPQPQAPASASAPHPAPGSLDAAVSDLRRDISGETHPRTAPPPPQAPSVTPDWQPVRGPQAGQPPPNGYMPPPSPLGPGLPPQPMGQPLPRASEPTLRTGPPTGPPSGPQSGYAPSPPQQAPSPAPNSWTPTGGHTPPPVVAPHPVNAPHRPPLPVGSASPSLPVGSASPSLPTGGVPPPGAYSQHPAPPGAWPHQGAPSGAGQQAMPQSMPQGMPMDRRGPPPSPYPQQDEALARLDARRPQPQRAPAAPAQRAATSGRPAIEPGQLHETLPRKMRVGIPVACEVLIARADVKNAAERLQNGAAAYRHEITITRAMTVRLRAPDGGFSIESTTPETQWIENILNLADGDSARWRWIVTARERGKKRLQLIVSARTVDAEGLTAETALPDKVIDVRVAINYGETAKRIGGWVLAAVIGGLLARFGESAFDAVRLLMGRSGG